MPAATGGGASAAFKRPGLRVGALLVTADNMTLRNAPLRLDRQTFSQRQSGYLGGLCRDAGGPYDLVFEAILRVAGRGLISEN
jgi:hypothetical protein